MADCSNLKAKMCGNRGLTIPSGGCVTLRPYICNGEPRLHFVYCDTDDTAIVCQSTVCNAKVACS